MKRVFMYGLMAVVIATTAPIAAQQPQRPADQSGATDQPRTGTPSGDRQGSEPATPRSGQSANADQQFVMDMAQSNMAEVELARLAEDKASSSDVKQFGQRLVTDHSKALDELKKVAANKNITLPAAVDAKHKATHDKLSGMSGAQFDRAFMQEMVQAHTQAVNKLQSESRSGKDADVKAWAAKTLPTVEEHLKQAKSISGRAVGTTGSESGAKPQGGSKPTPPPDR